MPETKCKYYKQKKQVSYDNGITWADVIPYEYQKGELYEMESQDCGDVPPCPAEYRWLNDEECVLTDKWSHRIKQVSYDCGVTWENAGEENWEYTEVDAIECGWVHPNMDGLKWYRVDSIHGNGMSKPPTSFRVTSARCNGDVYIDPEDVHGGPLSEYDSLHTFIVGDCVNVLREGVFEYSKYGNPKIHVYIPSTCSIGRGCFEGSVIAKLEWGDNWSGRISGSAFANCTVKQSNLPTTISSVGEEAFNGANFEDITAFTFNNRVWLDLRALTNNPFKNIIFNDGFNINYDYNPFIAMLRTEKVILNGRRARYPGNYLELLKVNKKLIIEDNTETV